MTPFYAGETRTAKVKMRNPTSSSFDYQASLILGLPEVMRSEATFLIPAGGEKQVSFPVIMPEAAGVYPVYVQVTAEGKEVCLYRAEDISVVGIDCFAMPPQMDVETSSNEDYIFATYRVTITNRGSAAGTRTIEVWDSYFGEGEKGQWQLTLGPGESYIISVFRGFNPRALSSLTVYVRGDWAGNNSSQGTAQR